MDDIFRPKSEPARYIYDAFQSEGSKRKGRSVSEWKDAERHAVLRAAEDAAKQHDLRTPTFKEICEEETSAAGHVDYGAKWVYGVVRHMTKTT